jgi:hypothetical protein
MGKVIDLTGQRFGMLRALECVGLNNKHSRLWRCVCDCGRETVPTAYALRSGHEVLRVPASPLTKPEAWSDRYS